MQLPAVLVRVIDPANGYFEKRRPRRRGGLIHHGDAIFGPGVQDDIRQATDVEIQAMRRRATELPEAPKRELTSMERHDVAAAVKSLLQSGHAAIEDGPGRCEAKIVRFWHGDSLLEIRHQSGSSLTRVPRRPGSNDEELLFSVLARHVGEPAE